MSKKKRDREEYVSLKRKFYVRLLQTVLVSVGIVFGFYLLVWKDRGGNWMLEFFQNGFGLDWTSAMILYNQIFRNNKDTIALLLFSLVFFLAIRKVLNEFIGCFQAVNSGIDQLLEEEGKIQLPPELLETERRLKEVKEELARRSLTAAQAEQRKNDLVMYLAHDMRTPMTSVIGYLSLLQEAPDLPAKQRAKYVGISLEKACRLEKMMNEFFEITRYNLQQITISPEPIDLYYLLVQLMDELSPLLSARGNWAVLQADENLTVDGDPDKLARVFNNVMKNAASYSFPNTEIMLRAEERDGQVVLVFQNQGKTIPEYKLEAIFEKFYRMDESRTSNTGGTGLGLAIAKEIVALHGGTIKADSREDTVTFTITLPKVQENRRQRRETAGEALGKDLAQS